MTESSVITHSIADDMLRIQKDFNNGSHSLDLDELDELAELFRQKYVQGMWQERVEKYMQGKLQERVDSYMMELRLAINAGLAEIVSDGVYTMKGIPHEDPAEYF